MDDERMRILKRIEAGEISAEEAVRQLGALAQLPPAQASAQQEPPVPAKPEPEPLPPEPEPRPSAPPDIPKGLTHFWVYPLWAGVAVIVVGAILLYAVYGAHGSVWLSLCGWPIFASGVLITAAAWWLRTARWIHVRVSGKENITISLPLPLKLTAWAFKIAQPFVPQLRNTGVDEVIMGLSETLGKDGQPIYVDVNDEEEGEHVQVYIG